MATGVNGVHGAHVLKHVELDQKLEEDIVIILMEVPVLVHQFLQQAVN